METTAMMNNGLMRTPRISRSAAPEMISRLITGQTSMRRIKRGMHSSLSLKVARVAAISIKLGFMQPNSLETLFPDRTAKRPLAPQIESLGGEERSQ
jgi:hypothetical protein